jgi:hypothetical protein
MEPFEQLNNAILFTPSKHNHDKTSTQTALLREEKQVLQIISSKGGGRVLPNPIWLRIWGFVGHVPFFLKMNKDMD